ncbi:MAG: cyclodeaminase/cyclohydrolase family protein [Candidatus Omnitrophica bacterium]|nr:cyclodeaminase/cyclohydrolase family protein [Candidatus Omnitrophota bacterium]
MKKFTSLSLSRYLAELSSRKPIPGGGSVSAYVACLAMGLAEMVAQIGMKKVGPDTLPTLQKTITLLKKTRKDALQIVDLDPVVYQKVINIYGKAKKISDPTKKQQMIDEALENSFRLQANLALLVAMAKKGAESLLGVVKGSIQNDLKISLALFNSAFLGAYETARINVVYLKDSEKRVRAEKALEELKKKFETKDNQGS